MFGGTRAIKQARLMFDLIKADGVCPEQSGDVRRGLHASVRFFVDHAIAVAVGSVARRQALRSTLILTTSGGIRLQVQISHDSGDKLVAYSSGKSLFTASCPALFVVHETPRELEHAIYLYLSEQLFGQSEVTAEIVREGQAPLMMPVLEGSSQKGPRSLRIREQEGL